MRLRAHTDVTGRLVIKPIDEPQTTPARAEGAGEKSVLIDIGVIVHSALDTIQSEQERGNLFQHDWYRRLGEITSEYADRKGYLVLDRAKLRETIVDALIDLPGSDTFLMHGYTDAIISALAGNGDAATDVPMRTVPVWAINRVLSWADTNDIRPWTAQDEDARHALKGKRLLDAYPEDGSDPSWEAMHES